jgi:hypothetical protein
LPELTITQELVLSSSYNVIWGMPPVDVKTIRDFLGIAIGPPLFADPTNPRKFAAMIDFTEIEVDVYQLCSF